MPEEIHINKILLPVSWLYGLAVWFRNKFFDWGILRQKEFSVPVISVGNIAVGGTGKTPHTEYLIRLLSGTSKVAVLSRGYKRKTTGYILADEQASAQTIGDEPYQMWQKFPEILVAVDKKRTRGIHQLLSLPEDRRPEVILLDDAFQHRYVEPSLSIVLTDSHRLLYEDYLLPAGRLREPARNISRAHIVIVTKCSSDLKPIDFRVIGKRVNPYPYQALYFTSLAYGSLQPVFKDRGIEGISPEDLRKYQVPVLALCGIADPRPFVEMLSSVAQDIETMTFPDHHDFTSKEIAAIHKAYEKLPGDRKIIVTTEKDAVRLLSRNDLTDTLKNALYYLPVEVVFNQQEEDSFKQKIENHVRTVKRNGVLDQGARKRSS